MDRASSCTWRGETDEISLSRSEGLSIKRIDRIESTLAHCAAINDGCKPLILHSGGVGVG